MQRIIFLAVLLLFLAAPVFAENGPVYIELADAPSITVDWSKGNVQAVTLHGNRTLVFTNGQKGRKYTLAITQDEIGSRTVTWPSSVRWPGSTPEPAAASLTTTANKTDYLSLFYNGVNYDAVGLSQSY